MVFQKALTLTLTRSKLYSLDLGSALLTHYHSVSMCLIPDWIQIYSSDVSFKFDRTRSVEHQSNLKQGCPHSLVGVLSLLGYVQLDQILDWI